MQYRLKVTNQLQRNLNATTPTACNSNYIVTGIARNQIANLCHLYMEIGCDSVSYMWLLSYLKDYSIQASCKDKRCYKWVGHGFSMEMGKAFSGHRRKANGNWKGVLYHVNMETLEKVKSPCIVAFRYRRLTPHMTWPFMASLNAGIFSTHGFMTPVPQTATSIAKPNGLNIYEGHQ